PDRLRVAGEEVPARRGRRPPVARHGLAFPAPRLLRAVPRVEAHDHDVEVPSRLEREALEAGREAGEELPAEHGAAVVDQREHGGTGTEVSPKRDVRALLLAERQLERERRA